MRRRDFLHAASIVVLGTAPLALLAQPQRKPAKRIAFLSSSSSGRDAPNLAKFKARLGELGYAIGKDVVLDERYANGEFGNFPRLLAELIGLKPDILMVAGAPAAHAAQKATQTIPIVMTNAADPVGIGLVASLARPGGNITGQSDFNAGLVQKLFELVREMVPKEARIGVLSNPSNPANPPELKQLQGVAAAAGIKLVSYETSSVAEIDRALAAMGKDRPGALIVFGDPLLGAQVTKIVEATRKLALPSIFAGARAVELGALMSYGANFALLYRGAASYVDRIFKGASPADLPIEQPSTLELVVNRKTAKALGVTIPQSILLRADRVIE